MNDLLATRISRAFLPLFLMVHSARADFLDGRAVNSSGIGVANLNIDVVDLATGNMPSISGDLTNGTGFFHVTMPSGNYRVIFKPPAPPASTDLYTSVEPVFVAGTTNIGTVTLLPGVSLSGRVLNPGGAGVANVDLDTVILATGVNYPLVHDLSDGSGNFIFAAPAGAIELRFDPSAASGQTLAPRTLILNLSGSTALGNVSLAPGFIVSAIVRGPAGQAVGACDGEAIDATTGVHLYTPGDDSSVSGFVDFTVPAGTYNFEFCAPMALHLANTRISGINVSANTTLGIVTLPAGLALSGTVLSYLGQPVDASVVQLRSNTTGTIVPVCNEKTDAAGLYSMIVPSGDFRVVFLPPDAQVLGSDVHYGFTVNSDTTLDGTLPPAFSVLCAGDGSTSSACPCANFGAAGHGCANSQDAAGARLVALGSTAVDPATGTDSIVLSASGMTSVSSINSIFLQGDAVNSSGSLFGDGVLCLSGFLIRLGSKATPIGAAQFPGPGNLSVSQKGMVVPGSGAVRNYQTYYRNAAAAFCPPETFNVSNGVQITW